MAIAHILLTHGAGAPVESDFIVSLSRELEKRDIRVTTFNFDYMGIQVASGKKRPPSKAEKLITEFNQQIATYDQELPLFIGGKSMGGRIATMVMAEEFNSTSAFSKVSGVIAYGYPFHPPGKPEKLRVDHLSKMTVPLCVLQGERDTFGKREEVETYSLNDSIRVSYLSDGDHSFKPRKATGITQQQNIQTAAEYTLGFIKHILSEEIQ